MEATALPTVRSSKFDKPVLTFHLFNGLFYLHDTMG